MFPYDAQLAAAVEVSPASVPQVLQLLQTITGTCADGDGLKWFTWLYLQVTSAVEDRVSSGGFADPAWLAELDVQFANLYFQALAAFLSGAPCPGCWQAMFASRNQTQLCRLQFALAGMNAHINHDLPLAIIATCKKKNGVPQHGTPQYADYSAIDGTLDALIDAAKQTLNVRLLGDPVPAIARLEDMVAAWDLGGIREAAWNTAECLWQDSPFGAKVRMDSIAGLTTVIGKSLLIALP